MRKRTILSFLALFSVVSIHAQNLMGIKYDDPNGLSYEFTESATTYDWIKGFFVMPPSPENTLDHYKGNVVIPDSISYNGTKYEVTGIYDSAFDGCKDLESVTIPEGIKVIENNAFHGCTGLKSVIIPSSVIYIKDGVFSECTGLHSITLSEGIVYIGDLLGKEIGVFEGCTSLTSIKIPSSVRYISGNPFAGCSNLEQITVDPNNSFFNSRNNCNAIISSIDINNIRDNIYPNTLIAGCSNTVIPSNVRIIAERAFSGSGITAIDIPNSVIFIKAHAFGECSSLSSVRISASVNYIEDGAFGCCEQLSSLTVDPANRVYDSRENCNAIIESIDSSYSDMNYVVKTWVKDRLVVGCNNTVIPQSVTSINSLAFYGCNGIQSFILPKNITNVGLGAFIGCSALTSLKVDPDNSFYDSRDNCNAIIETATNKLIAGCSKTIIPNNVSEISAAAFREQVNLKSIEIPYGIISIGQQAFYGCTGLEEVKIPSSVTTLNTSAFALCSSMSSIEIPSSITVISYSVFLGCSSLKSIFFNWERLGSIRFYSNFDTDIYDKCILYVPENCYDTYKKHNLFGKFADIRLQENDNYHNVDGINYEIISTQDRIASVRYGYYEGEITIPSTVNIEGVDYTVQYIGSNAFVGCKKVMAVNIPEGIKEIGSSTFQDCIGLATIKLPESLEFIGDAAFKNCTGITSIKIPESVFFIGNQAFSGCSSLTSLNIPDGIQTIESGLVQGCSSMVSIDIPSSVTSIGYSAFKDCGSLESLIIPEGVTELDNLFKGCKSLSYLLLPSTASFVEWDREPFSDCDGLKTAGPKGGGYNLEFNWDTIPANLFNNFKSLRKVIFPKSLKVIYESDQVTDDSGYGLVFPGCDSLEFIAVSFSDTKLIRVYRNPRTGYSYNWESEIDYNLYRNTPVHTVFMLDDSIKAHKDYFTEHVKEIIISQNAKSISSEAFGLNLERIDVETENTCFSSVDGVLFSKDKKELLVYPSARSMHEYTVPEQVALIADNAFSKNALLQSVTIPESVETIGTKAFEKCQSLKSVTIKGTPLIDTLAFINCDNIEEVTSWGTTPQGMSILDTPQTIMVGEYEDIDKNNLNVTSEYNPELGRKVSLISKSGTYSWDCTITTTDVPAGKYRVSMGILPSPDNRPNLIHPTISSNDGDVLLDSIRTSTIMLVGRPIYVTSPATYSNDISGYDLILFADTLSIPEGVETLSIRISSNVSERDMPDYSSRLLLDRIFFEPLDKDIPADKYAGPFTESVFNNATLYVPEGAVSAYQNADGWKLFKYIAIDTDVEPVHQNGNGISGDINIYDIIGRRVSTELIDQLAPGLYIINGNIYLKR